eukprot:CAMPEP_0175977970 /NCGR_PEP_ID=MMETSP0108-20121206/45380_1 /TAXON_ID=195067 ORGANISM="Goniomonas pacifica, Strain CCMP1869" /NCGR_SAMPLE_ID=MMETSP0108 /ASSEMBLY_ACC=CAM_ASM_000204 /LENGTH=53 /DNA_ID=CAMNT_0017308057 /DNA_START=72 /DNA_END=233 /DNA_ORIENTATION=-
MTQVATKSRLPKCSLSKKCPRSAFEINTTDIKGESRACAANLSAAESIMPDEV